MSTMMTVKPRRTPSTKLRTVSSSDNHLFHPRVPIAHTIEVLDRIIANDEHAAGIDILYFAGDVFDREIPFGSDAVTPIYAWMIRLLRFCSKYDIVLRILYGTPSHDRKQSSRFYDLIEEFKIDVDFKYVNTLSIEFIARFGINVLYVPDEWRTDPAVTLGEVKDLLAENHLDKVDFAVMHGCFQFQLPPIPKVQMKAHVAEEYLALVRHHIFIGHHHTFSVFDRICSHGSTTRLAHGEEGPKGYVVHDLMDDDSYVLTFVQTPDPWTFKRVQAKGMKISEISSFLTESNFRKGSYIEFVAEAEDEVTLSFKDLCKNYSFLNLTLARPKVNRAVETFEDVDEDRVVHQIGEHNVDDAICEWLARKNVPPEIISQCREGIINAKLSIVK